MPVALMATPILMVPVDRLSRTLQGWLGGDPLNRPARLQGEDRDKRENRAKDYALQAGFPQSVERDNLNGKTRDASIGL
jgi:hypothetical protein